MLQKETHISKIELYTQAITHTKVNKIIIDVSTKKKQIKVN